ncbi:glycosyltransferase [Paludibaculum fermentans]|uniref:Glycosyltransferase n=1 Tax=Paludibaculum fermentans TaxID=1473598 RepID=A0A7S7SL69_PALFE|nr:glycosyltransferase [Paludibaculum fermentans]QOY88508.1 glycosyltransferase [Paludibaculum fermentans]
MLTPILIPAYEADPELQETVTALRRMGFTRIVVVDDGSRLPKSLLLLNQLDGVHLLKHAVNLGKGAALKTGLNHILLTWPDASGVVTADADGQHSPEDIAAVAAKLRSNPGNLILGSRQFRGKVPWRSKVGNRISATLVKLLVGTRLTDTQTGLRGIPLALAGQLLKLPSNGYEFELDMLLAAKHRGVPTLELPIRTIYLNSNSSSHFDPLWDSMRIYLVLMRFTLASVFTAVIDNAVFAVAYNGSHNILLSQLIGRSVAVLFNYAAARKAVFLSRGPHKDTLPKYLLLVTANAAISYVLITLIHDRFQAGVVAIKVAVEAALFLASFLIQRDLIFSRKQGEATDWTSYYESVPPTAKLTRKYSGGALVRMMRSAGVSQGAHFVEIGGANSCFYDRLAEEFRPSCYEVIDTNRHGLDLLGRRASAKVELRQESVLELSVDPRADVVFSAGLVEHFDREGTRRAIEAHFDQARPGGTVIITFPTPTLLYRITRKLLEVFGLWKFPDERALLQEEVRQVALGRGEVLEERILWPLILTQGVVVVRKRPVERLDGEGSSVPVAARTGVLPRP